MRPINKQQRGNRNPASNFDPCVCVYIYTFKTYLFDIEDKEVFNSADGRQQGAVEGADPADGLTVDDLQHVLRNSKLLLAPPLGQTTVTVLHYQPEEYEATQ